MKIEVFEFKASVSNIPEKGGGFHLNTRDVVDEINNFCEGKNVIDIKVNTIETKYHNNAGCNEVYLVYTVIYS